MLYYESQIWLVKAPLVYQDTAHHVLGVPQNPDITSDCSKFTPWQKLTSSSVPTPSWPFASLSSWRRRCRHLRKKSSCKLRTVNYLLLILLLLGGDAKHTSNCFL